MVRWACCSGLVARYAGAAGVAVGRTLPDAPHCTGNFRYLATGLRRARYDPKELSRRVGLMLLIERGSANLTGTFGGPPWSSLSRLVVAENAGPRVGRATIDCWRAGG